MKYLAYILTGAMLLTACSRSSFEVESKATIDSLLLAYDKLQVEVESMPSKEVKSYFKEYKAFFAQTQKDLSQIQVDDLRDLSFMDTFKGVKKGFKKFPSKQNKYQQDLERKVKELNSLLQDINNDIFDEQAIKQYLDEEQKALKTLQEQYNKTMTAAHKQRAVLDSLKVVIPQKIEALR